ncbi:sensor histidine kinase [Butyrivibrio sp. CB08]|uniref:sensor histidine kinase n=1 Tax=Butyrivibrio sp. CB08 TaxID=2364879 RepID=UPI000EA9D551|nr:HAMP domain-containing sensor histidine kinase [Butyrivibrio sp. CB08]RKM58878.1 sensor histidine kinase [Butyrivibrio sp. CB08]
MVNKLRKKFVITATLSLLLVLAIMIAVINLVNIFQMVNDADNLLNILTTNDGYFPGQIKDDFMPRDNGGPQGFDRSRDPFRNPVDPFAFDFLNNARSAEMPYMARYFWVRFDQSGTVSEINTRNIIFISEENAREYATSVYNSGREKGFYHSYRFKTGKNADGSTIVVFTDLSSQIINVYKLLGQTLLIGAFALLAMFILVFLFSGQAVAPVVESLEKQKRFITDAGHELKTPLAVISANVDVLELESGKSEWTGSIKNQVKRMNSLVKNMLTLSRMDEERMHVVFSDFDMSAAVKETSQSFEAIAESKDKKYQMDIEDGIHLTGDKNSITQLTSLLLDNAMKYSSDNGSINVSLSKNKNIVLEVSNTCDCIPEGNLDRLFDRFYRADSSRSRETGGYGIGLSVARAIANSHGGEITALRDGDHMIRFVVTLPKVLPKNLQKANGK